jgi:hypothetical protein
MRKIAVEYPRNSAKRQQEELHRKSRWEKLRQHKAQIDAEEAPIERLENGADNGHLQEGYVRSRLPGARKSRASKLYTGYLCTYTVVTNVGRWWNVPVRRPPPWASIINDF